MLALEQQQAVMPAHLRIFISHNFLFLESITGRGVFVTYVYVLVCM